MRGAQGARQIGWQRQNAWQFPLGHGRACPGHPDHRCTVPSRSSVHRAILIEIAGTSPAMTNRPPRVLPLLPDRQASAGDPSTADCVRNRFL